MDRWEGIWSDIQVEGQGGKKRDALPPLWQKEEDGAYGGRFAGLVK